MSLPFPAKPPQASAHSQGHHGPVVNSPEQLEGPLQPPGPVSFAEQARCDGGIHGFCQSWSVGQNHPAGQQVRPHRVNASALSGPALQIR
jgi:hypothetical protein